MGEQVIVLGSLREEIVRLWTDQVAENLQIVLTTRRRTHFLERHPDVARWETRLANAVQDPDEVHRNQASASTAIFYKRVDAMHYLRVVVAMQPRGGRLKHSVITCRLARRAELEKGRERRVWP